MIIGEQVTKARELLLARQEALRRAFQRPLRRSRATSLDGHYGRIALKNPWRNVCDKR